MKISFVISSMAGGGAERALATIANELCRRGAELTVITYLEEHSFYPLDSRIKFLSLYKKEEVKKQIFNRIKRKMSTYFRLRKVLSVSKPDVAVSFIVGMNGITLLSSLFQKYPVIVYEQICYNYSNTVSRWLERHFLYKLASMVTVLTEFDVQIYSKFLSNVMVMPNPLSFQPIQQVGVRKPIVLAVGHLERWEQKGFDNLIKVWAKVVSCCPEWQLHIAGRGDQSLIKNWIIENGVQDSVILLSEVKNMEELYQSVSIFILSSRYEGFPVGLLEAMSQGCACISYDCKTGPNEIITHKEDGILVEDQNGEKLEKQLCHLIEDEGLRYRLSTSAIKNISQFSEKNIVSKWESLIREIT